jgi:hypothetical protein
MQLKTVEEISNSRILWTNGDAFYIAKGMRFWSVGKDGRRTGIELALGTLLERMLSLARLSRQFFRLGIHQLWPLPGGVFLVVVRKRIFLVEPTSGKVDLVFRFLRGNKPAHRGVCVTEDGCVFIGEYVMNHDRKHPISLYRSLDCGKTFKTNYTFEPGVVRHIHFVQWDPFACCLWMGTGDADEECRLFKSTDRGDSWNLVGGGSQFWRAVGVAFRPEALYWGTDAGSDAGEHQNYVMRLDRKTGVLDQLIQIQGPCHGTATLKNGTIIVSTGVEGGVNEKDKYAHLWVSREGSSWQEVACFRKDIYPYIVQYGILRFPHGLEMCEDLAFTGMGLVGAGERGFIGRLS